MSEDLATRLLAAIEETERIAQAAVGKLTGVWAVEPFKPSSPVSLPASAWVDDGDEGMAMVNGSYRADHIAHNDPTTVLRRCAADRTIVDEYLARHNDVDLMLGPPSQRQKEWSGLGLAVRLLAEGYGITEEDQ